MTAHLPRIPLTTLFTAAVALSLSVAAANANPLKSPYPKSPVIERMELDWSTHQRHAPGSDNFQLTWAEDGHLYGAWGDGGGFGGTNSRGRVGLGVARIEGGPKTYTGTNIWGGHEAEHEATFDGKSWGLIALRDELFMWVVPDNPDGKDYRNHYEYIELAHSSNHGASWTKADWRFYQNEELTIPTFLNFGKNNSGAPKAYGNFVYSYFIHPESATIEHQGPDGVGLLTHKQGKLYLARARPSKLMSNKSRYQFFTGLDSNRQPTWGPLSKKAAVFEDPNGAGWCLSASYNPHYKRVILATQHSENAQGQLGFFDSPTPWGPWTTIKYHQPDDAFGQVRDDSELPWRNNVFFAAFATKWMDGDRFVLNFTGAGNGKDNDSFNTVEGAFIPR